MTDKNEDLPQRLSHYTTQSGFLGILQSRSIWATKIQCLNDAAEFQLALDITRDLVSKRQKKAPAADGRKFEQALDSIDSIKGLHVCVACFSEHSDSLSQWRAYAGNSVGYELVFDARALQSVAAKSGFKFVRCEYDEKKQVELLDRMLDDILKRDLADAGTVHVTGGGGTEPVIIQLYELPGFFDALSRIAPQIKNAAFKDEREWRLVSAGGINLEKLEYRNQKSMLAPYTNVTVIEEQGALRSVVVGPGPHQGLAQETARMCLVRYGVTDVAVSGSRAPFRNW